MKLIIHNKEFGDKIVMNPEFIPRVGELIDLNFYYHPEVIRIVHEFGKEHIVYVNTE